MSLLVGFLMIVIRVTAMLIVAPVLGHRSVPVYAKLILAVMISIAAAPLIMDQSGWAKLDSPLDWHDLATGVLTEAIIGGLLGLGMLITFASAQMIGAAVGQMAGLQLEAATTTDPSIGQLPIERLVGTVAVAMFVLANGPELLLAAVLDSFAQLPIGTHVQTKSIVEVVTRLLRQSFELTVLAIAPAVASLLVSTLLVGMLMRTLPQLNLIHLGLSSNITMMMLALALTLGGCSWMMIDELEPTIAIISDALNLFARNN